MSRELPINPRIIAQSAKATIRSLPDAIVELVTNSDDSYKRLEEKGLNSSGGIEIEIDRKKYGICEHLRIVDYAEGMNKDELEKALEFAGETSGFESGKSVRGLFGRGLKEAVLALGEGEIKVIRDGQMRRTRLYMGEHEKALYDDELLEKVENTHERNGTEINIKITNNKIKIPEYKMFREQISNHFALRDICNRRKIILIFRDKKRGLTEQSPLSFSRPPGTKVYEENVKLPIYGDEIRISIFESPEPLQSPKNNPWGLAGILIQTRGATLDNKLFEFDNEPAAFYFFGEAVCNQLEDRIRKGETDIIDFNRAGLNWRNDYCQAIEREIVKRLKPLVSEKKKSLEKKPEREIKDSIKKIIRKLCSELNRLANLELEEGEVKDIAEAQEITGLLIKPEKANIEIPKPRKFSIYAPNDLVSGEEYDVRIESTNSDIYAFPNVVKLIKHQKYPDILWHGTFNVEGMKEDAEGNIIARLGAEVAIAMVKVRPPGKKKRSERLTGRRGGFVSDIMPDPYPNPIQRAVYEEGVIKVYTKSPSVERFIGDRFEGIETQEGKMLMAELVGDAFCRGVARKRIEQGIDIMPLPGGEMDYYENSVDTLKQKYMHIIQDLVFQWKFED